MSSEELSKVYEPAEVEKKWYSQWEKNGYFRSDLNSKLPPFSVIMPPPNVTGSLHMGHALDLTLPDIVCRYKRLKGFNVLWLPGSDHAGIATQNVVEKALAKEGLKRQDLGREKFLERVWEWKEKYGGHITEQIKRMGASCDWERSRFTMDEGSSRAVREAFVLFYEKGFIERDKYLVNWCPRCQTAISDLEVEHEDKNGKLWYIKYPIVGAAPRGRPHDGQAQGPAPTEVIVATTRPETMLGDTAVAVNPSDDRYKKLVGKKIKLPLTGREITIIADHRVSMEFGTGAVKVTPAHDFNDFAFGNDHKLERINLLTEEAKMNENCLEYKGMDRFECRKKIIADLEEKGFLEKVEDHLNSVGHCERCHTIVEPYLSMQWFVRTDPLAKNAAQVVQAGKTQFIPKKYEQDYLRWMNDIKDWCISRQIWWGHRIPAWYCANFSRNEGADEKLSVRRSFSKGGCPPIVSRTDPKKCPACGCEDLEQDTDVLDTWFSSGLWPMSTLGWPEKTKELKTFYPTSLLVTGFDIIFFWVARMMMMGLEFSGDVPFKQVHIHALVRDEKGQKMSKSKGNGIDPLKVMDQYGTDAFRFTLAALAGQGRDVKLSEKVIEGYRNFTNKIWNATRFSLMNLDGVKAPKSLEGIELSLFDQWILETQNQMIEKVDQAYDEYKFDESTRGLYDFFWKELCDWYLEFSKLHLNKEVLAYVLERSLILLHPVMPFLTEELWQKVKSEGESIMLAEFPKIEGKGFAKEASEVNLLREIVSLLRNLRSENKISPAVQIKAIVYSKDKAVQSLGKNHGDILRQLAKLESFELTDKKVDAKGHAHAAASNFDIFVPLAGLIDLDAERGRIEKEIAKLQGSLKSLEARLASDFVNRAPPEIVAAENQKKEDAALKLAKFEETLKNIQS